MSKKDWKIEFSQNINSILPQFSIGGCRDNEGCKLGELKILNHLQGDLLIEVLRHVDVYEAENAQLKKKIHLRN